MMKMVARQMSAILRPFITRKSDVISGDNKVVGAFIFDSNNRVSANNHLVKTRFLAETEEDGNNKK